MISSLRETVQIMSRSPSVHLRLTLLKVMTPVECSALQVCVTSALSTATSSPMFRLTTVSYSETTFYAAKYGDAKFNFI